MAAHNFENRERLARLVIDGMDLEAMEQFILDRLDADFDNVDCFNDYAEDYELDQFLSGSTS